MSPEHHRQHAAFSLVELLVVIAVIAVLLSLTMPVLSRARDQAKQVHCASKLRSLGQFIEVYRSDFKAFYTANSRYDGGLAGQEFITLIHRYLPDPILISQNRSWAGNPLLCPAHIYRPSGSTSTTQSQAFAQTILAGSSSTGTTIYTASHYRIQGFFGWGSESDSSAKWAGIKREFKTNPSNLIMVYEGFGASKGWGYYTHGGIIYPHFEKTQVLMADSSTRTAQNALSSQLNNTDFRRRD